MLQQPCPLNIFTNLIQQILLKILFQCPEKDCVTSSIFTFRGSCCITSIFKLSALSVNNDKTGSNISLLQPLCCCIEIANRLSLKSCQYRQNGSKRKLVGLIDERPFWMYQGSLIHSCWVDRCALHRNPPLPCFL